MAKLTREKAITKLRRVEDALLHAKGVIQSFVDDLRQVREWLESAGKDKG